MYAKKMMWFMSEVGLTMQSDISLLSRSNKRKRDKTSTVQEIRKY